MELKMLGNIFTAGNESWWLPKIATMDRGSILVDIIIHYPNLRTQAMERLKVIQLTESYRLPQVMIHVPALASEILELLKKCIDHEISDLWDAFSLVHESQRGEVWKLIENEFTKRKENNWSVADGQRLEDEAKSTSPFAIEAMNIILHIVPTPAWKAILTFKCGSLC